MGVRLAGAALGCASSGRASARLRAAAGRGEARGRGPFRCRCPPPGEAAAGAGPRAALGPAPLRREAGAAVRLLPLGLYWSPQRPVRPAPPRRCTRPLWRALGPRCGEAGDGGTRSGAGGRGRETGTGTGASSSSGPWPTGRVCL